MFHVMIVSMMSFVLKNVWMSLKFQLQKTELAR